jgi:hypothetical protein
LEEVSGDSAWSCHREAVRPGALTVTDRAYVNPDVRAACLVTVRHCELVLVRWEMTQPV